MKSDSWHVFSSICPHKPFLYLWAYWWGWERILERSQAFIAISGEGPDGVLTSPGLIPQPWSLILLSSKIQWIYAYLGRPINAFWIHLLSFFSGWTCSQCLNYLVPTAPGLSWLWALINQSGLIPRLIPKKKKKKPWKEVKEFLA